MTLNLLMVFKTYIFFYELNIVSVNMYLWLLTCLTQETDERKNISMLLQHTSFLQTRN